MSIFYDPRKKKPHLWTSFIFILIAAVVAFVFYYIGQKKAVLHEQAEKSAVPEPRF